MDFDVNVTLVAVVVGALVGLTGVGAGALMTPVLIAGFGVSPAVAIATDLLYASVTKLVGGLTHLRHGGVQWPVLRSLWAGGLIGVGVGVTALLFLVETTVASDVLRIPLALVILLAAASLLWRAFSRQSQPNPVGTSGDGPPVVLTTAGALGMALLTRVSPRGTSPRALVGTDLLFAVPIALVSGLSYFVGGLVDLELLANLLIGSLPGVLLGSALAAKAPARLLNVTIGLALIAAAFMMVSSLFAA